MIAMDPVWKFLNSLDGFEFAAFWISFLTAVMLVGFFLDYVMERQGFGPYFNSIFVLGGIWCGLYVRFNFLQPSKLHLSDPFLAIGSVIAVTGAMLVTMAFVRNRTS